MGYAGVLGKGLDKARASPVVPAMWASTALAIAAPSSVAVPRPSSSRATRDLQVGKGVGKEGRISLGRVAGGAGKQQRLPSIVV